ncbi:MAG: hypothetical protein IBX61_03150 [Thermoleophilia bacterium]|nr:hypothetical protein [Thermoleophilia bacterium]
MKLKLAEEAGKLMEQEVTKLAAMGPDGYFCILPHHVDFISLLFPGLLIFDDVEGRPRSLRLEKGLLVKCGDEILISAARPEAAPAAPEGAERERQAEEVVAGLGAEITRRYLQKEEKD